MRSIVAALSASLILTLAFGCSGSGEPPKIEVAKPDKEPPKGKPVNTKQKKGPTLGPENVVE